MAVKPLLALLLVGSAVIRPAWLQAQRVSGRVVDEASGQPIAGVQVVLNAAGLSVASARTGPDGGFSLAAPAPGAYRVRFQVPGYRMLVSPPLELGPAQEVEYSLRMTPVPAEQLDTLLVEGRPVSKLLAGFYRRRANAFGNFLTRDEFLRWGPAEVTDIVRHLPLFDVLPSFNDARGYRIVGGHERRLRRSCPPIIYRDGVPVGTADVIDIDLTFGVDGIDAVEAYPGDAGLPAEFWSRGSNCGVLALWSRTSSDPVQALRLEVMGHFGARVGGAGGASEARFGAGFAVNFAGSFEFTPVVNLVVPLVGSGPQPSGFQALLAVRMHPLGLSSPWYVGTGVTGLYLSEPALSMFEAGLQRDEGHHILLTGVSFPVRGRERPYLELQLFDPFKPASAQVHAFVGLSARLH